MSYSSTIYSTLGASSRNLPSFDTPNNLSPFFEADFPAAGTTNEYWARLSVSRITKLSNGWARIRLDNIQGDKPIFAGFRINPTIAFGISSQQYTLTVEVANFKRIIGREPVLLLAGRNKKISQQLRAKYGEPLEINSDGMHYLPLVSRRSECDFLLHLRFSIAPTNYVEFDVRIGLFEGQYNGPWRSFYDKARSTGNRASHAKRTQRDEIVHYLEIESNDKEPANEQRSPSNLKPANTQQQYGSRNSLLDESVPRVFDNHFVDDSNEQRASKVSLSNKPAIEFLDVVKTYKLYEKDSDRLFASIRPKNSKAVTRINAVNHLSFTIYKGEAVALFGHNGAGKSTTLKMITGVTYHTSGSLRVNGRVSALLELTAGFDPKLTGRENIILRGQVAGLSDEQIHKLEPEIIEFADLGQFIDQPLKTYSSGMKSRLGFAFAVSINPDILVIDEILAVGDKAFRKKCIEKMREIISNQGVTVLFVTHSSPLAKKFCTRGLVLDHGSLVFDGDIKSAVRYYNTNL